jgi:hypothetical protein
MPEEGGAPRGHRAARRGDVDLKVARITAALQARRHLRACSGAIWAA